MPEIIALLGGPHDGMEITLERCPTHGHWPVVDIVCVVHGEPVRQRYLMDEPSGRYTYRGLFDDPALDELLP